MKYGASIFFVFNSHMKRRINVFYFLQDTLPRLTKPVEVQLHITKYHPRNHTNLHKIAFSVKNHISTSPQQLVVLLTCCLVVFFFGRSGSAVGLSAISFLAPLTLRSKRMPLQSLTQDEL